MKTNPNEERLDETKNGGGGRGVPATPSKKSNWTLYAVIAFAVAIFTYFLFN